MIKKIGLGFLALILILIIVVAVQPSAYHVERKTQIAAPAKYAHAIVNDFHAWKRFNPWEGLDPNPKTELGGAASGKGATLHWSGNDQVGEGTMTIEESTPELVKMKQEFVKPMAGFCTITFTFKPSSSGTDVTWAMDGENGFAAKAICLVMDMDKMVGPKFEEGLAKLKAAAEADAKAAK